ncbi:hypothetical protein HMSSN036_65460 [Paenibacillus macerans]|nr:hypothetical protein HMSSN036_65460 [Paenibacillus macerans]
MFIGPEGVDKGFIGLLISVVVAFVGGFILTYLFGYKNALRLKPIAGTVRRTPLPKRSKERVK